MFYNHPPCRISAKTILFEYDKTQITLTGTRELVITQFLDELEWEGIKIHETMQKEIKSWDTKLHWEM